MIIVQYIKLQWNKTCRGGKYAAERNRFPKADKLSDDFFDYIPFGIPVHRKLINQKTDGFHTFSNGRKIEYFNEKNSLILGPMELLFKSSNSCQLRYRYDLHNNARPERTKYNTALSQYVPLNEQCFLLNTGDYGRAVCNGRFVDWENWWYALEIVNVMVTSEKNTSSDCLLSSVPTHFYRQIAQLF